VFLECEYKLATLYLNLVVQSMQTYDVIIVGGGPTGVALEIELGLNNINTLFMVRAG